MNDNWNPLSQKRPTKADFNPNLGNLDEQSAWREFGPNCAMT